MEAFKDLHQYMIALTLSGHIGRQEAVSMLPPMFLDVHPNDIVLDMCAAPGSKTLQILEKVQKQDGHGIVVANDADSKRAYLLVHQVSHLKSSHIIVTTHLGQQYPFLRFHPRGNFISRFDEEPRGSGDSVCQSGSFDRVLCDVPCSGDGTLVRFRGEIESREKPPICGKNGTSNTRSLCIRCRWRSLCEG